MPDIERILQKYPPLKIQQEKSLGPNASGHTRVFIDEKGTRIIPNFKVGPEEHHRELFVWYERAFGRGMAGCLTHIPPTNLKIRSRIGSGFVEDYRLISCRAASAMADGTRQKTEDVIAAIKKFVKKYPDLYQE